LTKSLKELWGLVDKKLGKDQEIVTATAVKSVDPRTAQTNAQVGSYYDKKTGRNISLPSSNANVGEGLRNPVASAEIPMGNTKGLNQEVYKYIKELGQGKANEDPTKLMGFSPIDLHTSLQQRKQELAGSAGKGDKAAQAELKRLKGAESYDILDRKTQSGQQTIKGNQVNFDSINIYVTPPPGNDPTAVGGKVANALIDTYKARTGDQSETPS
jgi:hypothetical protein